jgi:hypothetical protein
MLDQIHQQELNSKHNDDDTINIYDNITINQYSIHSILYIV